MNYLLGYLEITGTSTATVAPTIVNLVTLVLRRTDAARSATEGGAAALGLALIVLEHEEFPLVQIGLRPQQRLVRSRSTPRIGL